MWDLKKSRSQFYVDCGRPEENFWKTLFEQAGRQDLINDEQYEEFLSWQPVNSNCPELQQVAKELTALAPIEWRATMKNIFVARAFKGDANAEASSFRSAGIIELNYGLTTAAMIYSTLFCHFYESIRSAATEVDFGDAEEEITQMIVDELERSAFEPILVADSSISNWATEKQVYAAHPLLIELPKRRKTSDYHRLVTATEMFVVAHEFAHHMLGHSDQNFRHAEKSKKIVSSYLSHMRAEDILGTLNDSQQEEIEADVASFLLLSGIISNQSTRSRIYRAVGGSMLALISLAHVNGDWISNDKESSHPDFLTRYEVLARLIKHVTMPMPLGEGTQGHPRKDHPIGFLIQFRGFTSAFLQAMASRFGGEVQMPNFLNIFSWMIDLEAEFKEEHRILRESDTGAGNSVE
ncbi:hypothetical protein ACFV2N_28665 [Streptomyces sp. NPDC059680]|uniref:hypothetical protein n=1 Tax=Streptomyces sp. NPDC059680 TaxID=3346904 RepID=UPI0036C55831